MPSYGRKAGRTFQSNQPAEKHLDFATVSFFLFGNILPPSAGISPVSQISFPEGILRESGELLCFVFLHSIMAAGWTGNFSWPMGVRTCWAGQMTVTFRLSGMLRYLVAMLSLRPTPGK
jgi:hypothetical protein